MTDLVMSASAVRLPLRKRKFSRLACRKRLTTMAWAVEGTNILFVNGVAAGGLDEK